MPPYSNDSATLPAGPLVLDAERTPWWRARRSLLLALALSVAVHAVVSLAPKTLPESPDATPLTASIKELPPPPAPAAAAPRPSPPKPRAQPRRSAPVTAPAPVQAEPETAPPTMDGDAVAATEPAQDAEPAAAEPTPPVLAEEVDAPQAPAVPAKSLPPRVDLAYKVYFGTQDFHVGSATYRFEHGAGTYRVSTIGEARGLAALFVRGQGRVESRGIINGDGLQPLELVVDKFNKRGTERASFDWEIGIATLHEWQFYFKPPTADSHSFALATTRRVDRVTVTRVRSETIEWTHGPVEAEVWHRTSNDGKTEAYVWLAPALNYIPVKIRTEHQTRGTLIALLDAILVEEPGTTVQQ